MALSNEKVKEFRKIGHSLKPVVIIGDAGLSEGVGQEIERALRDHELIKVKLNCADRAQKQQLIAQLGEQHSCELVQSIGNIALVYRGAVGESPKLSNVLRHYINNAKSR